MGQGVGTSPGLLGNRASGISLFVQRRSPRASLSHSQEASTNQVFISSNIPTYTNSLTQELGGPPVHTPVNGTKTTHSSQSHLTRSIQCSAPSSGFEILLLRSPKAHRAPHSQGSRLSSYTVGASRHVSRAVQEGPSDTSRGKIGGRDRCCHQRTISPAGLRAPLRDAWCWPQDGGEELRIRAKDSPSRAAACRGR